MVKIYHSYGFVKPIDQYSTNYSNIVIFRGYLIVAANQYISIISPKTGQIIRHIQHPNPQKTAIVRSVFSWGSYIYAGYDDGSLLCFSVFNESFDYQIQMELDSHQSAINIITTFSDAQLQENIVQLLTTGIDGTVIIYDLISEQEQIIKGAHKGQITGISTVQLFIDGLAYNCLITVGKDGYLKLWNAQNLMGMGIVGMDGEALSMYLDPQRKLVYVGTDSDKIFIIKLSTQDNPLFQSNKYLQIMGKGLKQNCWIVGSVKRNNHSKCLQMYYDFNCIYILNSDKTMEAYQKINDSEVARRKKKISKKQKNNKNQLRKYSVEYQNQKLQQQQINMYQLTLKYKSEKKMLTRGYSFMLHQDIFYINAGNNIISLKRQGLFTFLQEKQLTHSIGKTLQLHTSYPFTFYRSQTQCVIYSSSALFSNKHKSAQRLFSIKKQSDIKWCSLFNDGFLMIVFNDSVSIYDLAKNQQVLSLQSQQWQGCWIRGSNCLLWKDNHLAIYQLGVNKQKEIKMNLVSQFNAQEKINQASYINQSTQKYLLNLQNNTMQFNHTDTHRSFLTMRGHKLPILSYTVSTDDMYMVTGSIDKDIRLWDLQFGYCVKHLFAHKAPVTVVRYVKDTHYLFSGGRDGLVKMWDMDTYELIFELDQMIGQVKDISITNNGEYFIAGGVDGGIRIWQRTSQQVVAGDYEQKNQQKIMIEEYATNKIQKKQKQEQSKTQTKVRYQDLKYGEQIIEALQNSEHPTILADLLKKISPGNLRSSLSFLHNSHVQLLHKYMTLMIKQEFQLQLCFRTLEALKKGPKNLLNDRRVLVQQRTGDRQLSKILRENWKTQAKILRTNRQMLKLIMTSIKESKEEIE